MLELGVGEEQIIRGLPEKYRRRIREERELMDLLDRAHSVKEQRVAAGYGSAVPFSTRARSRPPS